MTRAHVTLVLSVLFGVGALSQVGLAYHHCHRGESSWLDVLMAFVLAFNAGTYWVTFQRERHR